MKRQITILVAVGIFAAGWAGARLVDTYNITSQACPYINSGSGDRTECPYLDEQAKAGERTRPARRNHGSQI
jgi:hypothetical protein